MPFNPPFILAALVGLSMGSFGNVLLHRIRTNESFGGRSKCPSCGEILDAVDLVPILSYLWLRGRCRRCRTRISFQYPFIEAGSMTVFIFAIGLSPGDPLGGFLSAFILSFLLLACVYDARYHELPDLFTWWIGGLAVLRIILLHADLRSSLMGASISMLVFGVQWILSRGRALGSGDVFLASALGLFLGAGGTVTMIVASYIVGALTILVFLLAGKVRLKRGTDIAFGPFLGVGTLLSLIGLGDVYLSLFH